MHTIRLRHTPRPPVARYVQAVEDRLSFTGSGRQVSLGQTRNTVSSLDDEVKSPPLPLPSNNADNNRYFQRPWSMPCIMHALITPFYAVPGMGRAGDDMEGPFFLMFT